jgi:hypothetical protein
MIRFVHININENYSTRPSVNTNFAFEKTPILAHFHQLIVVIIVVVMTRTTKEATDTILDVFERVAKPLPYRSQCRRVPHVIISITGQRITGQFCG